MRGRLLPFVAVFSVVLAISSFARAADLYRADICAGKAAGWVSGPIVHECVVGSGADEVGPLCSYAGYRFERPDRVHYACPAGAEWSAYDVDQDGVSNGDDLEPYNGSYNFAPGVMRADRHGLTAAQFIDDVEFVLEVASRLLAVFVGVYLVVVVFCMATGRSLP